MSGKLIPLKQLASIELKKTPGLITHYNLSRTALITADLEKGANLDVVMKPVIQKLNKYPFPNGCTYRIAGELESRDEAFGGMKIPMIIALISIFAVLILQFKSFSQPLIIFTAIPLALIGSIWALFITGNTFSFTALIGLLSLIGIVINNSIILVDYTNKLRDSGKSIIEVKASPDFVYKMIELIHDSKLMAIIRNPYKLLKAAGLKPGQKVLEIGCGPGAFRGILSFEKSRRSANKIITDIENIGFVFTEKKNGILLFKK